MTSQVLPEQNVLILQISVLVRDQEPRNKGTGHGKRSANQEDALDALVGVTERVLDGDEDLSADGSSGLADGGSET